MARRGYVVCGVLMLACSSSERVDKRVSTTHATHATLDLLRTYPDLAPRATGLALSRAGGGWRAEVDPAPPSQTGPRWIDTRDLQTGFHATFPIRAGQPVHVGVSDTIWIDLVAEGDAPVEGQHVEGALVYAGARADHDVVLTAQRRHLEELRVLRSPASGSSLKYRVKLGPGVSQLRVREGVVEVLDHAGTARLRSDPWFALDAHHRRIDVVPTLEGEGTERVLSAKLSLEGAAYPVAIDPGWGSPTSMAIPRRYHQATVLASGKVLVTGGESTSASDITSSAELFDPATRTWTIVHAMNKPRTHHGTALLPSGKVLAIGNFYGSDCSIGSGSELYDPSTDSWTAGPFMGTPRGDAGVAVLSSGKVFVGGGRTCGGTFTDPSNTADVYDPGTNTWKAATNNMSGQHSTPAAQPFGTDKAVLAGGWPGYGTTSNAEVYDAATNSFTAAPKMSKDRGSLMSTTLADGRALVIGGTYYASSYYGLSTVETFVPAGGIFSASAVPAMPTNRQLGGAVRLSTGKVLVAFGGDGYPSSANVTMSVLYDPGTNTWSNAGNVSVDRWEPAMVPLAGGAALAMGGRIGSSPNTASVELWADAVASGSSCVSNGQCATGFCADGVCCDRACTGGCEACAESGSVGTCKLVTGAPRGTRPACTGSGSCGGTCDGAAIGCTYPSASVVCVAPTCIGGSANGAAYCNGAGACGTAPSPVACAPYGCGATGCKTTCAADADCDAASYCKGTSCVAKEKQGDPCSESGACATGFCADGVCCATACGETCKSCNVSGSVGVCTTKDPCTDDAGADASPDTASDAEPDTTPPIDAVAETPAPNWGTTPKVEGSFQKCVKGSECPTGFCVEGICCDSPCTDRCHSCALITSPGKCTVEPIGVDLKNECGPALTCLGTCGGGSECIGSGNGTMCGRNRCTGPTTGVGPAYCPGPGGKCDTDDAVPFECSPYNCEPAFGACRTTCASSADCAHDFVCDLASQTCIALPPPEDTSGCAVSDGKLRGSSVAVFLVALAGIARRQRRRASR